MEMKWMYSHQENMLRKHNNIRSQPAIAQMDGHIKSWGRWQEGSEHMQERQQAPAVSQPGPTQWLVLELPVPSKPTIERTEETMTEEPKNWGTEKPENTRWLNGRNASGEKD